MAMGITVTVLQRLLLSVAMRAQWLFTLLRASPGSESISYRPREPKRCRATRKWRSNGQVQSADHRLPALAMRKQLI